MGFVGLWHGRESGAWSGVPARIIDALEDMGVFGEYLDATPSPSALETLRRVGHARSRGVWMFEPVPRALQSVSNAAHRLTSSKRCDAWIVPAMGYGRPVGGRVASLCEVTPAQLDQADPEVVQTMWADITPAQLRAFGRQQVKLHHAATACCVASGWAGASLVRDHGVPEDRVHVVGYGANVTMVPPPERDWSRPRFLFAGIGWERKNGDRVLRAFSRLREEVPSASLELVGDHPRIDLPGVTGHGVVRYQEERGRCLLESLYRDATCFVMPSIHEHFGIVYVEAASAGLPSIGTAFGGTETSIAGGGVLVDPFDDDALKIAMLKLSNPEEAQRLGAIAHRRSKRLTWHKTAERIVRALDLPGIDQPLAEAL